MTPLVNGLRLLFHSLFLHPLQTGKIVKGVLYLKRKLNEMMAQHTGQPIEVIERDSDRDRFMGAEEAVKYGLIDRVLTNRTEATAA